MGSALENLGVSAGINLGLAAIFVACYSVASRLPINTRVYFPALFQRDPTKFKETGKAGLERFRLGFQLLDWLKGALKMPEEELISMAGLDAVMVLRVFFFSLKMLFPMAVWGAVVLIPINMTDDNVDHQREINPKSSFSSVDQLSLSNVRDRSDRMWAHLLSAYMFTFWAFYCLWKEYDYMTRLRLGYMADLSPQPDQFTVLATEIPAVNPQADETVSKKVARYFRVQYPDLYFSHNVVINANPLWALVNKRDNTANKLDALAIKMRRKPKKGRPAHKTGFLGLWGSKVDSIDFYEKQLSRLREEAATESNIIQGSQKRVVQSAFVTFRSRWGAAVAAQTQVSRNPQMWITEWAPEPRDVHWPNMGMPKWQRGLRRLIVGTAVFLMVFFYMVPISLVQSLANLNSIRSIGTPVKEIMDVPVIAGFVSGFLPGLVLKLFLALLPLLLRTMSTFEGHPSTSTIVKETCVKMYYFQLVNVFFGSILTGSLFQQLRSFLAEPTKLPETLGNAIPSKSSFFITYIMVDGWAGFPAELLRLWPLLLYHIRVAFFVVTDRDRDNAMNVQRLQYEQILPSLLFYILLGLVYAPIAPLLLPFLLLFLVLGYVVYKNQIINVYDRRYESCAGLWPFVTMRIISALLVAQITLLGVLSLKLATSVAPFALPLPVLTLVYSYWLRDRFEANFQKYPLESANAKDVIDQVKYPTWDLREISDTAYTHPALAKGLTLDEAIPTEDDLKHTQLVPIKAKYKRGSNPGSGASTPRASRPSSPGRHGPPSITDDEADLDHKV